MTKTDLQTPLRLLALVWAYFALSTLMDGRAQAAATTAGAWLGLKSATAPSQIALSAGTPERVVIVHAGCGPARHYLP